MTAHQPHQDIGTLQLSETKTRQQAVWSSGDYAQVGTTLQIVGENLAEALALRAGERVLDVAAGNGNFSLAAARRSTAVTSTDFVAALLDKGRERARAEGVQMHFEVADAEALPYADGAFDCVGSVFGAMFTPDHARCAAELLRVCRPGGRVGMANWTPEGFVGRIFQVVSRHFPSPLDPPSAWGTVKHLEELFGQCTELSVQTRAFNFVYPSAATWLAHFRNVYGPIRNAFIQAADAIAPVLETELLALAESLNTADDGTMVVPGEYLEVVVSK